MADDFLGSVAQEDVQFVTGIVKTVNPGDNYKHLIVYTDDSQIASGASLAAVKNLAGSIVAVYAEVTADSYKNIVKDELAVWLTDYFSAGGNESVYVVNVQNGGAAYSKALLEAAFAVTHQWAYFKTICIADEEVSTMFHLDPAAAVDLAELCSTDALLSSAPLYPMSMAVTGGSFTDTAYEAVKSAGFDAMWVYHLPVLQADNTTYVVHNGALVALGLALFAVNASGVYAGNSFDMVSTAAITASGVNGGPVDATTQAILKGANINYFKFVGDTTGAVDLRGGKTAKGDVISAMWLVAYCNYYNKVMVANYLSRRNIFKSATSYQAILAILSTTVSRFVTSGRLANLSVTAPAYADLPPAAADEIVVPDAWQATYQDDLRTVKVYGTLYI
jgi:hypothetical protein